MFVNEMTLGILRVIATNPGALFRLLNCGVDWLAHLERHRAGEALLFFLQDFGCLSHPRSALSERGAAIFAESVRRAT